MGVAPVPTIKKAQKTRRPARRTFMRALPHLVPCVVYFLYLIAGSYIFLFLEGNNNELKIFKEMVNKTKNDLHNAILNASNNDTSWRNLLEKYTRLLTRPEWKLGRYENLQDGLSFSSSMMFCLITITTIGYGDIVPITWEGQIFVSLYAAFGIPLNVIFLADVGYLFAKLIVKIIRGIKLYKLRRKREREATRTFQPGKSKTLSKFRRKKYAKRGKKFKHLQKERKRAIAAQTPKGGLSASRGMTIHAQSALRNVHSEDKSKDTSFSQDDHILTPNGEQDSFESLSQRRKAKTLAADKRKPPKSGGLSASRNMSVHARSLRRRSPDEDDKHYARRPRGRRGAGGAAAKRKAGGGISASQHMSVHARSIMQRNLPEDVDSEETSNDEPVKTISGGLETITNEILVNDDVAITMMNSKSDVDLVGNEQLSHFDNEEETINAFGGVGSMASETTDKSDDDDPVDTEVPTIIVLTILISYIGIGAIMMMYVEGWGYGKALYFTIITLTTIGFGDIAPDNHYSNQLFFSCIIYTIFGLAVMSTCIALVQAKVLRAIDKITRKIRKHAEI